MLFIFLTYTSIFIINSFLKGHSYLNEIYCLQNSIKISSFLNTLNL